MNTTQPGRPTTRDEPAEHPARRALLLAIGDAVVPCVRAEAEWFADDAAEQRRAARHCGSCIAKTACGEYAITVGEPHGVWGGMTETELRREQRRRRRDAA